MFCDMYARQIYDRVATVVAPKRAQVRGIYICMYGIHSFIYLFIDSSVHASIHLYVYAMCYMCAQRRSTTVSQVWWRQSERRCAIFI